MRHQKKHTGLRQTRGYQRSLRVNLLNSLFKHDSIKTTAYKAKILKPLAEKLLSNAKKKTVQAAVRYLQKYTTEEAVAKKIINDLHKKYESKTSGFIRVTKLGFREGDAAPVVQIQII